MRFTAAAALFAFAASVLAQNPTDGFDPIVKPTKGEKVPAGSTYDIEWQPNATFTGTVSIALLGGASPSTLQILSTVAKAVDNSKGAYSWAVEKTLGSQATYGLKITWDSNTNIFQYSFPFEITGGSTSSGSSSASASATATASSTDSSTTAAVNSTTIVTSTVSKVTSSSAASNLSTTASGGPSQTTVTSIATVSGTGSSSGSKTSSAAVTTGTSGASSFAASSLALFGGLAVAFFSL
ncbi:Ser-Thr-rich glycosyl-phosphatidyl-inositol-anchored membrane family-domain-containing protein [Diplogelasinospora grovesii]|uniref:Ser-Thr-rich glycosyl-phosphatidyl-inositol-anchored membrane family-domain-containing protein n=1 Tax=Diplogelasinospora grovesii TaxID=303347 RepID=A0AAN6MZH4_9PEZI|nr:Ser-Thr-rich glycosyl-phosphatidyl-inositol-anchored membrane family-domain-containing protein [Diplogelasinospora grovesii]